MILYCCRVDKQNTLSRNTPFIKDFNESNLGKRKSLDDTVECRMR